MAAAIKDLTHKDFDKLVKESDVSFDKCKRLIDFLIYKTPGK